MNRGDVDNRLSFLILGVGARRLDGVLPRLEGEADTRGVLPTMSGPFYPIGAESRMTTTAK